MQAPLAYLGVDVSKATLDAVLLIKATKTETPRRYPYKKIPNSVAAITQVCSWVCETADCTPAQVRVILEATGVYHIAAIETLHSAGCQIVVCKSLRVSEYRKAIGWLNKTDKADAELLAHYGAQGHGRLWRRPSNEILELRSLLLRQRTIHHCRLREQQRAQTISLHQQAPETLNSFERAKTFYDEEDARVKAAIQSYIKVRPFLDVQQRLLMSIPGVGELLSAHLIGLFESRQFASAREAAAFAGLVPLHRVSGSSVNKRPRISRACDRTLRGVLFMPALSAITHKAPIRERYERHLAKGLTSRQAQVAIMHYLLRTAFGVLKTGQRYDPHWTSLAPPRRSQA